VPAVAQEAGPAPVAVSPTDAFEVPAAPAVVEAPQSAPVEQAAPAPVVAAEAAPSAVEPAHVEPARVETAPAEAVAAPAPAPVQPVAPPASTSLDVVLQQAGLVWVNTDADKFRAAQEAASRLPRAVRVPRERKPLPPVDTTPMQQVETSRH
ncbi:ribonuclease E/G, partial [Burkholderia territorii]